MACTLSNVLSSRCRYRNFLLYYQLSLAHPTLNTNLLAQRHKRRRYTRPDRYGWDEIALAPRPSAHHSAELWCNAWSRHADFRHPGIRHLTDMLASEDNQKVYHESRMPALRDTCRLCTTELDPGLSADKARLGETRTCLPLEDHL